MDSIKPDGFTLIEVLVVICIVGILAALAVPNYLWIAKDSKETKKEVTIARISEAKTQFYQNSRTTNSPKLEDLVPYLNVKPGMGTNAFFNGPNCLFQGCFPLNEKWWINPKGPNEVPAFEKLD